MGHLDDRVVSLCLRLAALLIDSDIAFLKLQTYHGEILDALLSALNSDNDALKFGGVEALNILISSSASKEWLREKKVIALIVDLFDNYNVFLVKSCCRLMCKFIKLGETDVGFQIALDSAGFVKKFKNMISASSDSNKIMICLELAWMLSSTSYIFIHDHDIVF
jgi:hypothetical protein